MASLTWCHSIVMLNNNWWTGRGGACNFIRCAAVACLLAQGTAQLTYSDVQAASSDVDFTHKVNSLKAGKQDRDVVASARAP